MKKLLQISALLTSFIICFSFVGCNSSDNKNETTIEITTEITTESTTEKPTVEATEPPTEKETNEPTELPTEEETEPLTDESLEYQQVNDENQFIENVETSINGDVGKDELITNVTLENKQLCIYVDLSKSDPSPFTMEDIAISRTSSITDDILSLEQYDNLWDAIIVDFGDLGKIINDKSNMEKSSYGRYFRTENFYLE